MQQLNQTFAVIDNQLVRKVVPVRGKRYEHRCPLASFERIAHAAEDLGDDGFTLESLLDHERLPVAQVVAVLAFLYERGVIGKRQQRHYSESDFVYLDAMMEFERLAENN